MTSGHVLFTLVPLTLLLVPVAWLCWRLTRSGAWGAGWQFLPGSLLFLGMGVFCLCFRFHVTRVVYRSGEGLAVIDGYTAPLFDEWTEPFHVSPSAYVMEEQKKFHSRSSGTYTSHEVYVGAPGHSRQLEGFRERAQAQALVDEVHAFARGNAPRMEFRRNSSDPDSDVVRAFMGGVGYLAGLGVLVLAHWVVPPGAKPAAPRKENSKRGGSRRGRRTR